MTVVRKRHIHNIKVCKQGESESERERERERERDAQERQPSLKEATHQRSPARATTQRLVKLMTDHLQLLQVSVWEPDVNRQRQTLIQVLKRQNQTHRP